MLPEPPVAAETKFNPWHDPSNGQFTFRQGGTRGPGMVRPAKRPTAMVAANREPPRGGMGGNIRPFQVPMTL
jgi:hypothetical protein